MRKSRVFAQVRRVTAMSWFCVFCLLGSLPVLALQSVTVVWTPSTAANVTGYTIHYGVAAGAYTNSTSVGLATNISISGLHESTTYFFAATALDSDGLESNFSKETAYSVPQTATDPRAITIVINGSGKVRPNLNNVLLRLGKRYAVTAVPDAGQEFAGWTGSITSSAARLTFVAQSNLVLQAEFVPSPFLSVQGRYYGLFYEANQVQPQSAGSFTFYSGAHGAYSGRLQLGLNSFSFSGKLDLQCQATNLIKRFRTNSLALQLRLGSGQTNQLFGQLTDGTWTADLLGDRALFNACTNPAPWAGRYTLVLPGADGDPALPAGDSYGAAKLCSNGTVQFSGTLADGTKISQSACISMNGLWPFYVPLYSGRGSLLSWLTFTNRAVDDLNGALSWVKPANASASSCYRAGFTNELDAVGSAYRPPAGPTNFVLALTNATVTFSDGNLTADFTNAIAIGPCNHVTNLSSNRLSLSFTPSSGAYRGSVTDPSTARCRAFSGVVFQKLNSGHGFLLVSNRTSRVLIEPGP